MSKPLRIRERTRRVASPPAGMRQEWFEYQVVGPRGLVLARFDLREQAEQYIANREANVKAALGLKLDPDDFDVGESRARFEEE